ncbi:MAG TPA: class I SAM-dependent methyltransferase [Xanthobacteraceae bacterium]
MVDGIQLEEARSMNLKQKIVQHYDELSPYYRDLWGVHIHHGYWKSGAETKEEAQEQLIRELVSRAGIQNGARILDVGCGLGGAAIYLNKALGAKVTGITISSTQIEMAKELVRNSGAEVRLVLMDAEALEMDERFDVVWSVEAISHLNEKARCFVSIQRLLQPGGTLVIADWFKSSTATATEQSQYLKPIERAMLLPQLECPSAYAGYIRQAGLNVTVFEDLSANVRRTWDLAIEVIGKPALWKFAAARGRDFLGFLQGFAAMKAGYQSKALVYGALIAKKL